MWVQPIINKFDFILIDNPPSLNLLTMNALVTSSLYGGYIIPVDMSTDALSGAVAIQQAVQIMRKNGLENEPKFLGILVCQYQKQQAKSIKDNLLTLTKTFPEKVFEFKIPHTSKMIDANNNGLSIKDVDPTNSAAIAYAHLADSIVKTASSMKGNFHANAN